MLHTLHVAGIGACSYFKRATSLAYSLTGLFPERVSASVEEFQTSEEYGAWLSNFKANLGGKAATHEVSPFVWIDDHHYIGGHEEMLNWGRRFLRPTSSFNATLPMIDDGFSRTHTYDYDLIVIGGGSGGLACSKAAKEHGARVAVLDFVKPSPQGTTWGLGGTCVNVGCIPKKLMHNAALIGDFMRDGPEFGWTGVQRGNHDWESLRSHVQDHIHSLNFGYRVQLKELEVAYLNKLGRFVDPHTLALTDKKGNTTNVTSARFVVATGGRPTPLDCPGADLAVSSDDLFSMEHSPGKTLVIGASYVALECAGFLTGFGLDVTIAVRSILLRGFDQQCAEMIGEHMERHGTKFRRGVVPTRLEKVAKNKIRVHFSNLTCDDFDTVLTAIGRKPDLAGLGLNEVGVRIDPKSEKILCLNEQTTVPHIYAIGDVLHKGLELTPVAIMAGKLLSKRLFASDFTPDHYMDYSKVATAVFTPLEYGSVGISEEEAREKYGDANIDVYLSGFKPLEHTMSEWRSADANLAKVIVERRRRGGDAAGANGSEEKVDMHNFHGDPVNEIVLGIHLLSPNAGEIIQGYGVAMKTGQLKFQDLINTVGIHPTIAEEFTILKALKSTGATGEKTGC